MAIAAAAASFSPFLILSSPNLYSSFNYENLHLSCPTFLQLSPHNYKITRFRNPRTTICQGKLNSGPSEEEEEEEEETIEEIFFNVDEDIEENESDEDKETESSLDLLFRFLQSLFKKLSKRAKKSTRSILPPAISPQLVSFAVDGVLLLTSLSIVKALLEVVCTLGGTVFIVILLLRLIWASVSHFQSSGNSLNQGGTSYGTT